MVQLVLVHSPLVGPATWDSVAALLVNSGYEVVCPDLTDTLSSGPPYCSRQIEAIAESAADRPAVLIGHSGAGPLLPAAGGLLDEVVGYVWVDAGFPIPGRSWMETVPSALAAQVREMADADGWLPPWSEWWGTEGLAELLPDREIRDRFVAGCPRLPVALFEELHPESPPWQDVHGAYLRLSEAYDEQAAEARALHWPVTECATHHLAMLTHPELVADLLLELLAHSRL